MKPQSKIDQLQPSELLKQLGESIRNARKLRMITMTKLAIDTNINRATLLSIEKGAPQVSIGTYLDVMYHLGFNNRVNDLVRLTRYFR